MSRKAYSAPAALLAIFTLLVPVQAETERIIIPPGETVVLPTGNISGQLVIGAGATVIAEGVRIENTVGEPAVIMENASKLVGATVIASDSSPLGAAIVIVNRQGFIENCVVHGGDGDGVLVLRGRAEIISTAITRSRVGIAARSSQVSLALSTIHGNRGSGIDAEEKSEITIRNSTIAGNGGDGITLGDACRANIEHSSIADNAGFGLRELFPGTDVAATDATAMGNRAGSRLRGGREILETLATIPDSPAPSQQYDTSPPSEPVRELLSKFGFTTGDLTLPSVSLDSTPLFVKAALDSPSEVAGSLRDFATAIGAGGHSSVTDIPSLILSFLRLTVSRDLPPPDSIGLRDALTAASARARALPGMNEVYAATFSDGPNQTLLEDHLDGPEIREESRRMGRLAASRDGTSSAADALLLLATIEKAGSAPTESNDDVSDFAHGSILAAETTPIGWIIRGDSGPNDYDLAGRRIAYLSDEGGDDRYSFAADADSGVSIVIDRSGNDVYLGRAASARDGIAMLIDLDGDDQYEGDDFTQAAASGGFALLADLNGNDRYAARRFGQSAAIAGTALLLDLRGNDRFAMASHGQAFAGPHGTALLLDAKGQDDYSLRGGQADDLRSAPQSLSFGQGFSSGLRPHGSGGVALLVDLAGDDNYQAGLFAEGSAYWAALGALIDGGGNDNYRSWQYVQGAGVHLAAGILLDIGEGMDLFHSWGVSQGCGHDLALGYLESDGGDDLYQAYSRAQGIGMSNGVGILLDHRGSDRYLLNKTEDGQGAGQFEPSTRRYGSIGLFYDGEGEDLYTGIGSDSSVWFQGEAGAGWDRGASQVGTFAASSPHAGVAARVPSPAREYMLLLSTGKSASRHLTDFSLDQLEIGGADALSFLAHDADPSDPREWEILRKVAGRQGVTSGQHLRNLLALSDTFSRTAMILIAIGSSRDSSSVRIVAEQLRHADTRVRRAATLALGEIAHPDSADSLAELAVDGDRGVRRLAVDALVRISEALKEPEVETLLRLRTLALAFRNDSDAWVRRRVEQFVSSDGTGGDRER